MNFSSSQTWQRLSRRRTRRQWLTIIATLFVMNALVCLLAYEAIAPRRIAIPETVQVDEQRLSLTLQASAPLQADDPADGTPTSTPTPEATATPTPVATQPSGPTSTPAPSATPTPRPTPRPPAASLPWPQTLNIVLLGSDQKPHDRTWRTDTIIIVAIEPTAKKVGVISVPRDLWIELPRYANRINTVDFVGGPELMKQALQWQLGIPIHYYARINFDGFVKAVDAVGGITVDVECRIRESGFELGEVDIPAGPVKMDGKMALTFVRSRMTTTDFDRMRRQQAVLLAFRKQLLSAEMLPRLPELVGTLSRIVETDIPAQTLAALVRLGVEIDLKEVRGFMLDERAVQGMKTESGAAVQQINDAVAKPALQNLINDGQALTEAIKRPKTWACK